MSEIRFNPANTGLSVQPKKLTGKNGNDNPFETVRDSFTPSAKPDKMGVIVESSDPAKLLEMKRQIAEMKGTVGEDLPLINGFSAVVNSSANGRIAEFTKSIPGITVTEDMPVEIIGPTLGEVDRSNEPLRLNIARPLLNVQKMWEMGFKGKGVTVAVIDSGISPHPDMKDRIKAYKDFVSDDSVEPYDGNGHGTHVSGIIAGDGSKSKEKKYAGIAPEASLVGIRVSDSEGNSTSSKIVAGIQWAVDNKEELGIDVINISMGAPAKYSHYADPMTKAVKKAVEKGIVVVIAAGNLGPKDGTIATPGISPLAITVGAMDDRGTAKTEDDRLLSLSSRGPTLEGLPKPDLLAPGTNITAPNFSSGYQSISGTSMATPMVVGVVALLKQAFPTATPEQIKTALMSTADDFRNLPATSQGAGLVDVVEAYEQLKVMLQ